ncbi:MAG: MmcQ/YjbR family DNA-binding protein [Caulobacter sp.]|nr:MmcQ/YjbR family DNA-binding protein [Caulobacter sp.]
MTREEFDAIALSFPGAEAGSSYGKPAYKIDGKFFTRVRQDDDSAVLSCVDHDEREFLMEADPDTFHVTAHYKDYSMVLARLSGLEPEQARGFLARQFRKVAKKSVVKAWEASRGAS